MTTATPLLSASLPNFVAGERYYFGFSGGTGMLTEKHAVRNILVAFGSPRCL
jgi:hypothetical protein